MARSLYDDFPEPYRSMGANALHLPRRHFAFLPEDELAYEEILRSSYPGLIYEEKWTKEEERGSDPPAYRTRSTLRGFDQDYVFFHFDGGSAPVETWRSEGGWWVGTRRAWPYARWNRCSKIRDWVSGLPRSEAPPNLGIGDIFLGCRKWIVEERRMAAKVLRLIGKVGTKNYCTVKWPSMEVHHPAPGSGSMVIGHHAMAWLRSDPRHVADLRINSIYGNFALRPGPEGQD
jgi:hypothetical protein